MLYALFVPSTRTYHTSNARPTSSHSIGLEGDTNDDGKMEFTGGQSWTVVIYEQQSWEGQIIDGRDMKQGREAPQAIPRTMETVLGGLRPSHRAGVGGKLEGEESLKTQALSQWFFLTNYSPIVFWPILRPRAAY